MTRTEAIEEACTIVALAYHSIGNYDQPSDGFCKQCEQVQEAPSWRYQNAGQALDYVRRAVLRCLAIDNLDVAEGFDPATGREIR